MSKDILESPPATPRREFFERDYGINFIFVNSIAEQILQQGLDISRYF